jgi:hypothetical protein
LGNTTPAPEYYYFNYTLNAPKEINITVVPSGGADYDIYANWTPGQCPTDTSSDSGDEGAQWGAGWSESIVHMLEPGQYCVLIKLASSSQSDPTFDLSLSCRKMSIQEAIIISPENKTYYTQTVDLTIKCAGEFASYDINRSLNNAENITFGFSVANDTEFQNSTTLSSLPWGTHNVYVTCYNGSVSKSTDKVFFTLVQPVYEFEAWVEAPELFTVGKAELVNIYVRNNGNVKDSYIITFRKEATKDGVDASHLIDVYFFSNRISSVEPGRVGNTFGIVTVSGPVGDGWVYFNITSDENSSVFQEVTPIHVVAGFPISLPEFGTEGFIQMLIFSFLTFLFVRIAYY